MPNISIYEGSNYAKISNPSPNPVCHVSRGNIRQFSNQSRLRLISKAQQINQRKILPNPVFITLTYPFIFPRSHSICKKHLDTFIKRLSRLYSEFFLIWRLEYQVEKGTKRGAPHYHIILFFRDNRSRVRDLRRFQQWLSLAWFEIVKSGDPKHLAAGTQAQRLRNWRGVIFYVGKYLAKVSQSGVPDVMEDLPGRFWGIAGRSYLPLDETTFDIPEDEFYCIRRIFRHIYESKRRQKYRYKNNTFGMSLYLDSKTSHDILQFITNDFCNPNITERFLP